MIRLTSLPAASRAFVVSVREVGFWAKIAGSTAAGDLDTFCCQ